MALYTTTGVARRVPGGLTAQMVRNLERAGLITSTRDSAGRRVFDDSAVAKVRAYYAARRTRKGAK